ncbi:hypothetical protein [Hyphococcus sp.]|jgi:hypothetical protein|uniref:hypothetical protein n=1 Tax=Hyphococcus sp. TaxID=2038636 RepID=UPI003D0EBB6B
MKAFIPVVSAALLFVAACGPANVAEEETAAPEESEMADGREAMACPVIDSRNWSAWVNAMPGPDAKLTLHVTGEIDLPTPGYDIAWEPGIADRSMTPVQRLMLTATPPEGMAAQVFTTETVKYEGPALVKTYGGVIVLCGGEPLAEITEVMVAE